MKKENKIQIYKKQRNENEMKIIWNDVEAMLSNSRKVVSNENLKNTINLA